MASGAIAAIEVMLTMVPRRLLTIAGKTARVSRSGTRRLRKTERSPAATSDLGCWPDDLYPRVVDQRVDRAEF